MKYNFIMNWPRELINEGKIILSKLENLNITPTKDKVLRFLDQNPNKIKVVILGQDPYPGKNVATGNAFAVNENVRTPKSLQNIFKEIKQIYGKVEADKTLQSWIDQGVLLLNTSLTTIIGKSNVHKKIWQPYTSKVIKWLDLNFNVQWILWGNEAQRIGNNIRGFKVKDAHPSPFSNHLRHKKTFQIINFIKW